MKNYIFLVIAILFLCIISCHKPPEVIVDNSPFWGEMSVEKNGQPWGGKLFAIPWLHGGAGIKIDSFDQFNIRTETIEFFKVPLTKGIYPLYNSNSQINDSLTGAGNFMVDDDVALGWYGIADGDTSSYITVTSYDSLTKEIKGTFEATFVVKSRPYPDYPDTMRFRNGKFHTKLIR